MYMDNALRYVESIFLEGQNMFQSKDLNLSFTKCNRWHKPLLGLSTIFHNNVAQKWDFL